MAAGWFKKTHWGLAKGGNWFGQLFLLAIRLYWGVLLVVTGFGKWTKIAQVGDSFANLGIPFPSFSAGLVATVELLGGIALILGLFSRFFALLLSILLIVALSTAHKEGAAQLFTNPTAVFSQAPFTYLMTALTVLSFGPGIFSFDYWFEKKTYGRSLSREL